MQSNVYLGPVQLWSTVWYCGILLICCHWIPIPAQIPSLEGYEVLGVSVDPIGQLYLSFDDGRIMKLGRDGQTNYIYDDGLLGTPDAIEVSDPFSPLLYFEEFQTIVSLDRTLNEIGRLDFRDSDLILQPGVFTRSVDDLIWVYDEWDNRIKLIDGTGQLERQTDNLRLSIASEDGPLSMMAVNGRLMALYPDRGIAVFSLTGQFLRWESCPPADHYQWSKKGLIGWTDQEAWRWTGSEVVEIILPAEALPADQLVPIGNAWLVRQKEVAKIFK